MAREKAPEDEIYSTPEQRYTSTARLIESRFDEATNLQRTQPGMRFFMYEYDGRFPKSHLAMFALCENLKLMRRGTSEVIELVIPVEEIDIQETRVKHDPSLDTAPFFIVHRYDQKAGVASIDAAITPQSYEEAFEAAGGHLVEDIDLKLATYELLPLTNPKERL